MRPVKEVTAEQENFRFEPINGINIIGYDQDCDGSPMARLEGIDKNSEATGWNANNIGIYSEINLVVTPEELKTLFNT